MEENVHNPAKSMANWPPIQLAQAALAGSILIASAPLVPACLAYFFNLSGHHEPILGGHPGYLGLGALILLTFSPLLIGGPLIRISMWQLSEGLTADRWTKQEIENAHQWIEAPAVKRNAKRYFWIFRVAVVLSLAMWAASYRWKFHLPDVLNLVMGTAWLLRAPIDALSSLRSKLRPRPAYAVPSVSGELPRRLQSEYWGERTAPYSAVPEKYNSDEATPQKEEILSPTAQNIVGLLTTVALSIWIWSHRKASPFGMLAILPFWLWFGWGLAHELRRKTRRI